jgi:hypothetical protein
MEKSSVQTGKPTINERFFWKGQNTSYQYYQGKEI